MVEKDVSKRSMLIIACPNCKCNRIVKRTSTLKKNFTGLCRSCFEKSKIKGPLFKFHPWRSNANYEKSQQKKDDRLS